MSVLIKDMQMPDNCYQCMISGFRTAIKCNEWTKISSGLRQTHRILSCPLVELPEHHGRLFDQDDVKAVLYDMPDTKDKWDAIALLEWAIDKRWCIEAEGMDE